MQRDPLKRLLKRSLRRSIVSAAMSMDVSERQRQEAQLRSRFPDLPGYRDAATVLLYVKAFPEEFDTLPLLRHALSQGKRVLCPRVDRQERRLRLYRIDSPDEDLEPGVLGIPEPHPRCTEAQPGDVDWALIPGLAFDERCDRLGRGGGHYDRLLPILRPDATRWALGFDCQLVPELPIEAHDVPVDGVATASKIVKRLGALH